jgi:P27 family predicted phage terminase small subunit
MRGPKPTPTPLRIIRGNPGKRPLPKNEPKAEPYLPPAPSTLSPEARKEWRRVGRELRRLGLVSNIDRALLAAYCEAWARFVEANDKLRQYGSIVKTPNGMPTQSPYLQIVNKATEQLAKIAVEFGMSPSARTRVKAADAPDEAVDKWAGLLS